MSIILQSTLIIIEVNEGDNMTNELDSTQSTEVNLPALSIDIFNSLNTLTDSLGIPRDVLANEEEISFAWLSLPREIRDIPPSERSELIAKTCVAISTGLFDGAINYIWNATILRLRDRVRDFGLKVVQQLRGSTFEEKQLLELQDSDLIRLCLELNLITEEGFFYLSQCREMRNNCSAAHPSIGAINDREVITFLNRCVRYALCEQITPQGVDSQGLFAVIKSGALSDDQAEAWSEKLRATHSAQRKILVLAIYGIYCDPSSEEFARQNAMDICLRLVSEFDSSTQSELINQHSDYIARGQQDRSKASEIFFEKLGLLDLLTESQRHSIVSGAARRLLSVHHAMNNFYNEPPFAERLWEISSQSTIPDSAQEEFVSIVVQCCVGNSYGVSVQARPYYEEMIGSFSQREIARMLLFAPDERSVRRIHYWNERQVNEFKEALKLINEKSVPASVKQKYRSWLES